MATKLIRFILLLALAPLAAALGPVARVEGPVSSITIFHDQVGALESDLATLLQRRLDTSGPEMSLIDYQIDMRLVERWMLLRAVESKSDIALQSCVALRVANLQGIAPEISRRLQAPGKPLAPSQIEGLSKLHQLSYKLPDGNSVAAIDEVSRSIATFLILIANPSPAEVKTLPLMRPQPLPESSARPGQSPRTLQDLTARAKSVQVSAPLKRQLVSLASAANVAAADAKDQDAAAALYDTLTAAIDLADGIEHSTGIDPAARPKIEQQLTEGLALYTDVRTRSAGKNRVAAMSQYRDILIRVQRLHLTSALQQKLAPLFVWVQNNPGAGGRMLETIEKYLEVCARYDARKDPVLLPPAQKKTVDGLQKQFTGHRTSFLEESADFGGVGIFANTGAELSSHVEQMRQALESIETIERLPHALQILAAYKVKPTGGLEKRAAAAVADLALPNGPANHDAAVRLLSDIERLAQLAQSLNAPAGIPADLIKAYSHGRMEGVEARKIFLLAGLSSQLAAGRDMDVSDFSKLQILGDMLASLRMAGDVEVGLAKADLLTRWADWSIGPAQLRAMAGPYRDATAAAFEGFADDNATPLFRWPDVHKRFAPILELIKEVGLYADQCTDLPVGFAGEISKLLTPMDNQPFAIERFASLAVSVWQHAAADSTDPRAADAVFDAMLAHLRQDLHMAE